MSEKFINPVLPVTRTGNINKNKKQSPKQKQVLQQDKKKDTTGKRKNIIDTYA
jgi:hypothetical protein